MKYDPFSEPVNTVGLTGQNIQEIELTDEFDVDPKGKEAKGDTVPPFEVDAILIGTPDASKYRRNTTGGFTYILNQGLDFDFKGEGRVFAYDLEAVPDEKRYPRPEPVVFEPREIITDHALKTEATIKKEIDLGITPEQATTLLEIEQEGKCRKGVISALRAAGQSGGDAEADWRRLATNPFCARIVAIGVQHIAMDHPMVMIAQNEKEERDILTEFFSLHAQGLIRTGYNIAHYDDRLIMWRAMMLKVPVPKTLHVARFGGKQSVDIALKLFTGSGDMVRLKTLLPMLGIQPPAGDVDGSHVLDMVDGGQWDKLAEYVASDAWCEMELFKATTGVLEVW